MIEKADNENLLVRYLLGNLPEAQQAQVEAMFLGDDQQYERLLALEDELFYDYAQGNLSPDERAQFKKRFLASGRENKRAILASAMAEVMTQAAPARRSEKITEPVIQVRQSRWRSLISFFNVPSRALKLSLAAVGIMLLISLGLAIGTVRRQDEFNRFQAERMFQEDRLQQQAQQERTRADELNLMLKRETDENAMLKQELSETQARLAGGREIPHATISFILEPGSERGQSNLKKLQISPGIRLLKLQLNLEREDEYKSYQALLLTADGAERWSKSRLRVQRSDSGQALSLSLPTRLLAEDNYQLILKGYTADGTLEETGEYYYFSIVRK
jgi:anti-sigma factor RsiW